MKKLLFILFRQQPTIDYYINEKSHQSGGLGGQLVSILNYHIISEKHTFGLTFQSGYKSSGYALGEQLDKGLIIGGGLTLKLGGNSH